MFHVDVTLKIGAEQMQPHQTLLGRCEETNIKKQNDWNEVTFK